jgi:hypothetical protein
MALILMRFVAIIDLVLLFLYFVFLGDPNINLKLIFMIRDEFKSEISNIFRLIESV